MLELTLSGVPWLLIALKICAAESATSAEPGEIFTDELDWGVGEGVGGVLECPPPQATRPDTRKSAQIPFSMLLLQAFVWRTRCFMPQRKWRKEILPFLSHLDAVYGPVSGARYFDLRKPCRKEAIGN